ncbi:aaa atpase [Anaeramoeba flamelloides]|uniref:Aaa atpase n=1 Tax=Anaeramoeba flamelloides TaxID=1746091 RepID=A0ABQ8X3V6_9EUKA|nr:aaa atpase [Anaeramoeba flamelloides]
METSNKTHTPIEVQTQTQTQTQKCTITKKYGSSVFTCNTDRSFQNQNQEEFGFKKRFFQNVATKNESVRALSSILNKTQPLQQKKKTFSRYANLFSLFGSRSRIPIYELPFEFGSSSGCNSRIFGRNGEFSLSLAKILIDKITKLRYLRVHGKTGKVLLNGGRLAHGHKIILKDGDNIEFVGKFGKRYSFIFLTEEFLINRQNKLKQKSSLQSQNQNQNQKQKQNQNQNQNEKHFNECSSFQKYFHVLPLKQKFSRGILLNKFRLTHQTMINEDKNFKFSSIEYPLDQTLTKLLKMNFQTYLNELPSSTPKQNSKSSFNFQTRKEGRKLLLTGPLSSMFLIEKISKALANELGLKYFVFDFLEMLPLLKVFKTIIKNKQTGPTTETKQKNQNQNQNQQQEQEQEQETNQKFQKQKLKNGDRILYVGPNFQNIETDQLIKSLSLKWKQKKGNNNNNNNNNNNQPKPILSVPKPGSFGKVVMKFDEGSAYSSPYVGVEFDQPLSQTGSNQTISNKNKRKGFFVKKSEIIKLDENVDQDHPAILCQELFLILKKINEPFLLFIPKIDQTLFYSYHIMEYLKSGINDLIESNLNAFIISGLEIGNNKLSRSESFSLMKTLQKNKFQKQEQQQQEIQSEQQFKHQKRMRQQRQEQLNLMNNEEKIEYFNKKLELLNNNEALSPIKKLTDKIVFNRNKQKINFLSTFLGQTIRIRKPKKKEQIEKWEKCIKTDQKSNLINKNCSLMKFICKKLKVSIKLKHINSNLFALKRYNYEEMNSIIGNSMTHKVQKNFLHNNNNSNKNTTDEIVLENDDLIYGINLFHKINDFEVQKCEKKDQNLNSKMDIENENENENEKESKTGKKQHSAYREERGEKKHSAYREERGKKEEKEIIKQLLEKKNKKKNLQLTTIEENLYNQIVVSKDVTKTKFKDIGGAKRIKTQIKEQIIYPFKRPELFHNYKLLQKKNFKGLLLYGPPGTGKTMIAQAIASKTESTFLRVRPGLFSSKWYGATEKNVEGIFSLAKKLSPSIIFIDEVDSILSKRLSNGNLENETSRRIKNLFMQLWEGITSNDNENGNNTILVIGATNRPYDLDEAILRRFEKKVHVNLPDLSERKNILKKLLFKNNLISDNFNLNELALLTKGFTGSDLKNLINASSYYPIYEQLCLENSNITSLNNTFGNTNLTLFDKKNINSSLTNKKNSQIKLRKLQLQDFKNSLEKIKSSININSLDFKQLNKWHLDYSKSNISIKNNFQRYF